MAEWRRKGEDRPGIALDYDGVIADTNSLKSRWIRRHLGRRVPPWETDRTICVRLIGIENYMRMAPEVYGWEASLKARPVPGVRRALRALAAHSRVYVMTARAGAMLRGCRAWMRKRGLERFVRGYLVGGRAEGVGKVALCAKLGIQALVDDDERHFDGLKRAPVLKILFKNGARGRVRVPRGARLFRCWSDLLPWLLGRLKGELNRSSSQPRRPARAGTRRRGGS